MQFKRETDELYIDRPLVTEGHLRGISSKNSENDKIHENNHDDTIKDQNVSLNHSHSGLNSYKSSHGEDLVTKSATVNSHVYNPHDQYSKIRSIKGRSKGNSNRSRTGNKWNGFILDPTNPLVTSDGKFIQTHSAGTYFNKPVMYGYGNNFLEYNLIGDETTNQASNKTFDSYTEENTINKYEHIKLPMYIATFAVGFLVVILVVCSGRYLKTLISKWKPSKNRDSNGSIDAESIASVIPGDDVCLAESRSNNPSLLKIDHYIANDGKGSNPLSDIEGSDISDEDYDEEDVNEVINRMRNIFKNREELGVTHSDEETPLLQNEQTGSLKSVSSGTNGTSTTTSAFTTKDTSATRDSSSSQAYENNYVFR